MAVLPQQEQHYNLVQYELKTRNVNLCQLFDMVIIIWLCYINRSSITTWCSMNWRHVTSTCVSCLTWWSLYAVLHQQEQHYNLVQYELKTRNVNLCQLFDMVIIIWLCYLNRSSITTWCSMNWRHVTSTCVSCLTWWSLYGCVTSTGAALQPGAIWTEDTHPQSASSVWHGDHYMLCYLNRSSITTWCSMNWRHVTSTCVSCLTWWSLYAVLHQQEQHYNLVQYELKTRNVNLCQLFDMVIIIWLCYLNRSSITTWCSMNWRHVTSTCVSCLTWWSLYAVLPQQEQHYNLVQYELKTRNVNLCQLFEQLEQAQRDLHIEDYSVSQNTLDNVSITLTLKRYTDEHGYHPGNMQNWTLQLRRTWSSFTWMKYAVWNEGIVCIVHHLGAVALEDVSTADFIHRLHAGCEL